MKVEKLYTLGQFVELIRLESQKVGYDRVEDSDNLYKIYLYNEFLKQPLKKVMFVNEIKKPEGMHLFENASSWALNASEVIDCQNYKESENKVIFYLKTSVIYKEAINEFMCHDQIVDTLEELSIASEGELQLKNVSL